MTLKSDYKKSGQKSLEKAVKLCVNTIYGITNQNTSPLYNYYSASSITAFGRKTLDFARQLFLGAGYKILSMDTDGLEV